MKKIKNKRFLIFIFTALFVILIGIMILYGVYVGSLKQLSLILSEFGASWGKIN